MTEKERLAKNNRIREQGRQTREKRKSQICRVYRVKIDLFGRTVQHSILGLVKAKLMKCERVTVLPSSAPTTKYCPNCGKFKKDIKLSDRIYNCDCGYSEDRDIHAARNMILLGKQNTCGTQGIFNDAFGEDVRRYESQDLCCSLVELGSPRFYKRG